MKDKIIDFIKRNRVTTTEVADCLGKSGVLPDVMPITPGLFKVGTIKWVYAQKESNWDVHEQVISVQEDDIVMIDCFECNGRSVIGELVCKYILLYRQASAIISNGKMRDAAALLRERYPVWCTGFSPVGCFNKKVLDPIDSQLLSEHRSFYDGAVAVCDDCGVVVIPKEMHNAAFLDKLVQIEEQEDLWFDRLDRHKENTFDIVCLKKYLKDGGEKT